jgi:hypothetical protein
MSGGRWRDDLRNHLGWQCVLVGLGRATGAWGTRTIVLLSSYRFGSSLMMNYLNAQPNIRRRGEILNPDEVVYGNFKRASQDRVLLHVKAMCFTTPGQIAMVKLMDSQIEDHGLTLDDVISALNQPYIVAVYRRDLLSAFVSLRIAQENGVWYSTDEVNDLSISIELSALKNYVHNTRRRWVNFSARLRNYNRSIVVSYEDLSQQPEEEMNRIFDFMGFPRKGPVTETVRQNPAPARRKVKNYRDLGIDELLARGELTLELDSYQADAET